MPEPLVIMEPADYNEAPIIELAAVDTEASEEPIKDDSTSFFGYGALALGVAASAVYLYKRLQGAKACAVNGDDEEDYMRQESGDCFAIEEDFVRQEQKIDRLAGLQASIDAVVMRHEKKKSILSCELATIDEEYSRV